MKEDFKKMLQSLPNEYSLETLYIMLVNNDYDFPFELDFTDYDGEAYISASVPLKVAGINGNFVFAYDAFDYGLTASEIIERIEELSRQAVEIKESFNKLNT